MGQKHSTGARKRDGFLLLKYRDSKDSIRIKGHHAEARNSSIFSKEADSASRLPPSRSSSPPPPYSSINLLPPSYPSEKPHPFSCFLHTPHHICPSQAVRPREPHEVLRRYMIEIIAQVFCKDFDKLNSALLGVEVTKNTTSILTRQESDDLLRYSRLINQVNLTFTEGQELRANIMVPAADDCFPLREEEMAELLSMYEYIGTGVCASRHRQISRRVAAIGLSGYITEFSNLFPGYPHLRVHQRALDSYCTMLTKLKLKASAYSIILQGLSEFKDAMRCDSLDLTQIYYLSPFHGIGVISYRINPLDLLPLDG